MIGIVSERPEGARSETGQHRKTRRAWRALSTAGAVAADAPELCGYFGAMTVRIGDIVVDCQNARVAADFWCAALGYRITETDDTGVAVAGDSSVPTLLFLESSDRKATKNRIHFDVCPVEGSTRSDEVARLESLGATLVDVGQTGGSWTVMVDPDGNEFCVMSTVLPPEPAPFHHL